MKFKLIKNTEEYHQAIAYLEQLGDQEGFHDNMEMIEEFELISMLIGLYEKENFPIQSGHPIEIIKLKMEYMGIKRKDLEKMGIASSGVLSEVFNKKRGLSKAMIRSFSKILGIDQNLLNPVYPLEDVACDQIIEVDIKSKDIISTTTFYFIKEKTNAIKAFAARTRDQKMLFNLNVA